MTDPNALQPRARHRGRLPRHGRRLPRPRPRPHPRHRAEPHGDRRRGQPLLARRARVGRSEPLRALVRHRLGLDPSRPRRQGPRRPSSAPPTPTSSPTAASRCASTRPRAASRSGRTTRHKLPICPRHYGTILRAGGLAAEAAAFDAAAPLDPADRRWSELKAGLAAVPDASVARALAAFAGTPGDPAAWSRLDALIAAQHWRAGEVQPRRRRDQLPPLLHHQRPRRRARRAPGGLRRHAPPGPLACSTRALSTALRIDHIDGLRDPKAYTLRLRSRVAAPRSPSCREDPRRRRGPARGLAERRHHRLRGREPPRRPPRRPRRHRRPHRRPTPTSPAAHEPPAEVVHAAKRAILASPMAAELEAIVAAPALALAAPRRDLGRGVAARRPRRGRRSARRLPHLRRRRRPARRRPRRASSAPSPTPAGATRRSTPASSTSSSARSALEHSERPRSRDARAAAHRPGHGQGPRGHRPLPLQPPDRAQRGRQRARRASPSPSTPSTAPTPSAWPARPRALLATSTHDTKRGEDARARIAALTGHAAAWRDKVFDWHDLLADPDRPIDRNEEYFFYQLLLGAWPAEGAARPRRPDRRASRPRC